MKKTTFGLIMTLFFLYGCEMETKETVFEMPEQTTADETVEITENMPSSREINMGETIENLNNAAANEFFTQGIAAAQSKDYEKALELFDSALELVEGMNKMKVLTNKASVYYNLEQFEEAIPLYEEVIALDPDFYEHYSNKGAALLKMGQYDDAIELYKTSLEKEINNFPAYYNMACAYALKGDTAGAIEHLQTALSIRPEAKDFATQDTDLQALWDLDEFKTLIAEIIVPEGVGKKE
jgi:tetratricopeptide (TPR) repeat protein